MTKNKTWYDILLKRVSVNNETKAVYEEKRVQAVHVSGALVRLYGEQKKDVSINDILFGESNFFEVLFGDEMFKGTPTRQYQKMGCLMSTDKLAYLNSVLD